MEYLMTYGWAILIVIVVGAVLVYYGVFKPPISKTTSGFGSIAVLDHDYASIVGPAQFKMQVENRAGDTVTITDVSIDGTSISGNKGNLPQTLTMGSRIWIIGNTTVGTAGDMYTPTIVITYTKGSQALSSTGTVSGQRS